MCLVCLLFSCMTLGCLFFFFFKQKTAYELRISDWSSDVCSSDLIGGFRNHRHVDGDAVALLDATRLQGIGEAAAVLEELAIGDVLVLGGAVALPDDGGVVLLGRQVTVDAVVAGVGVAIGLTLDGAVASPAPHPLPLGARKGVV